MQKGIPDIKKLGNRDEFGDNTDILKFIVTDHTSNKNNNIILAKPTEQERDFIIKERLLAKEIVRILNGSQWGWQIHDMMLAQCEDVILFARNREQNPLIDSIKVTLSGIQEELSQDKEEKEMQSKLKRLLGTRKKDKEVEI